jgi:hypothetical protein
MTRLTYTYIGRPIRCMGRYTYGTEQRRRYLYKESFLPMSSILSQLAIGKSFNKIHQPPANIYWAEDKQTIYHLEKPVVLGKVQEWC